MSFCCSRASSPAGSVSAGRAATAVEGEDIDPASQECAVRFREPTMGCGWLAVTAVIALVFGLGHPKPGFDCARRLEPSPHVRAAPQPDFARPARTDLYRPLGT